MPLTFLGIRLIRLIFALMLYDRLRACFNLTASLAPVLRWYSSEDFTQCPTYYRIFPHWLWEWIVPSLHKLQELFDLVFLVFPFPASDGFLIYIRTPLFSQRVEGPFAKLQSFVCAASSCLILCLPHSNHCLVLFGSAVPELWPENCSHEVSWGNHRTHHLFFLRSRITVL